MNAKRVSAAAGVIHGSQVKGKQTAAGIAADLEAACMLQSPESAAELVELRRQLESERVDGRRLIRAEQRTAELEAVLNSHRKDDQATIDRLRARVAELEQEHADAVAVSEALNRALHDEKLAGSALYSALTTPTTPEQQRAALERFLAVAQRSGQLHGPAESDAMTRTFAPTQALREDPHDSPLHHEYRVGRDMPQPGGAQ